MIARLRRSNERSEGGFFTIWVLALCSIVLFVGLLFVSMWHIFDERRQLAAMVDGAAIAGSNQINLPLYQASGVVTLDEDSAIAVAEAYLDDAAVSNGLVINGNATIDPDTEELVVTIDHQMEAWFLLGPIDIRVEGRGKPLLGTQVENQ